MIDLKTIITIVGSIISAVITVLISFFKLRERVATLEKSVEIIKEDGEKMETAIEIFQKEFNKYCKEDSERMNNLLNNQNLLKQKFEIFIERIEKQMSHN